MTTTTLKRNGSWVVELQQPLHGFGREHTEITIRPATADHMIRWGLQQVPSTMALLAELCDIPEKILRQLPIQDFNRVMLALNHVVPDNVKTDWNEGNRPLATAEEELPLQEQGIPPPDPEDPRFPKVDGPVVRMKPGPPTSPEPVDDGGMNLAPPTAMHAVR